MAQSNSKDVMLDFYHQNDGDLVWWTMSGEIIDGEFYQDLGVHLFSFDKKKVYNLFSDYPHALSKEELEIFNKENPFWVEFFSDRQVY